jgi:hypothetical protein
MNATKLSDLIKPQRDCVTLLSSISFGRIESLCVRGGNVVLDPPPTIVRTIKLTETVSDAEIWRLCPQSRASSVLRCHPGS